MDCNEWHLVWHSESMDPDTIDVEGDWWPFNDETAYAADWEALGIAVTIA
jgi:hypothetical protein